MQNLLVAATYSKAFPPPNCAKISANCCPISMREDCKSDTTESQ